MNTLVILHGWGHDSSYWSSFMSSFHHKNIYCPNLPGFGDEPLVNANWGIPEYSEWVTNWIEKKNLTNVIILGHSFGGRIGSQIASKRPSWLKGLVLYAAPCIYRPSLRVKLLSSGARFLKPLKRDLLKNSHSEIDTADEMGMGKIFRKAVVFDQSSQLPAIHVPTLLVWGENDLDVPVRIAHEMHTLIQSSTLITLDKLGHNAHLENPTLFYGTITSFITNL